MSDPLDNFWRDVVGRLRRALGLGPLSRAEAERELLQTKPSPLSESEIADFVRKATAEPDEGDVTATPDWNPGLDTSNVEEDVYQLNRNLGDEDAEVDERVQKRRREILDDDEPDEPEK